jgi:hypothetical protein
MEAFRSPLHKAQFQVTKYQQLYHRSPAPEVCRVVHTMEKLFRIGYVAKSKIRKFCGEFSVDQNVLRL